MDLWTWGNPVAWAVFLVGCGISALLLSLALKFLGHATDVFVKLPMVKKR